MLLTSLMTAAAPAVGAPPAPNPFVQLLPFVLMFVVFYFLLIRPQQQARKRHMAMVAGVKRGDRVVTAGGLVGKVTRAGDDNEIQVELADGVVVTVLRNTLSDVPSRTEPEEQK